MEYFIVLIPGMIALIAVLVHIETSISILKTDVKWIIKQLNDKSYQD